MLFNECISPGFEFADTAREKKSLTTRMNGPKNLSGSYLRIELAPTLKGESIMRRSSLQLTAGVALSTVLLLGGALINSPSAFAAKSPKLFVTPSSGLKGGETVTVHGTGFKPKDNVYVVECLATAKGAGQCNTLAAMPVTISAKGILPKTKFQLVAGPIGNGSCGTTKKNLKSCEMSAGNASGGDSATARFTFKLKK